MNHVTQVCREHKTILLQCRCPGPHDKLLVDCRLGAEKCRSVDRLEWDDEKGHGVRRPTPHPECCRKCEQEWLNRQTGAAAFMRYFIVCSECGNKRCPKASDHTLSCTGSNEPNQPGSDFQYRSANTLTWREEKPDEVGWWIGVSLSPQGPVAETSYWTEDYIRIERTLPRYDDVRLWTKIELPEVQS